MNQQLFRMVYCSRNRIRGSAAEVDTQIRQILQRSRENNAAVGVTGALLYNAGNFAQILEGPVEGVGKIFEKLQLDARHSEVTVVESGMVDEREFADWSMAFSNTGSNDSAKRALAAFDAGFAHAQGAGDAMLTVLKELVQQEDDWALVDVA